MADIYERLGPAVKFEDSAGTELWQTITRKWMEQADGSYAHAAALAAGEDHVGQVGGHTAIVDVALTLDTDAYADGDVLAEVQEVSNALRTDGGSGLLQSVIVIDKSDQGEALDIYLFSDSASLGTENAAVSISDADAAKIVARVEIGSSDYYDLGGVQVAVSSNLAMPLEVSSGTSIWLGVVSRGTGTYSADGIVVRLGIIQD